MPLYLRKSVKAGPFRFNFSKGGIGMSVGVKGVSVGTGPRGHYIQAGRGGLYYRTSLGQPGAPKPQLHQQHQPSAIQPRELVFHDEDVNARAIVSGKVLAMQAGAFSTVLDEIKAKQRQVKMSVVLGWIFGIVGLAAAINIGGDASILFLLGLPAWAAGRWLDSFRRVTVLFYDLESEAEEAFNAVTSAFDALAASQGKWHVTASGAVQNLTAWKRNAGASHLVRRKSTILDYRLPGVVKANVIPPAIRVGRKTIYFLPDVALIEDGNTIGSVGYQALTLEWANSRFIEEGPIPRDAEVVDHTWQHPNKKGGPDRRFKNNRQLPVCLYETLHLHSDSGLNELFEFSRRGLSAHLAAAFSMMSKRVGPTVDAMAELDVVAERKKASEIAISDLGKQNSVASPHTNSPPSHRAAHKLGWVPKGEAVVVADRSINGMVYIGSAPRVDGGGYGDHCRAYIDPALAVSSNGADRGGDGLPYWPGYSSIPAECRATYLDWLADGAKDGDINPGFMFLYFYGLERRYLIDKPEDQEKRDILAEVCRLKETFVQNHSVQRYLGDFIDLAGIMLDDADIKKPIFKSWTWDLPLSLKVTLGGMIANDIPLEAEWLLSWFLCHPEKRLRTAAHRCEEEFRALFVMKFNQQFPKGLKVTKSRRHLKYTYRAASGEFGGDIPITASGKPVLDISGLTKPVSIAQEIADEAMDGLDRLSRLLGRNPERKGSFEAHALLPACLWEQFPSMQRQELICWVNELVAMGGLVPINDVLKRMGVVTPGKIGKRQLIDMADTLGGLGFGLAPDPRHALRLPKEGEPVVIFAIGETYDAEAVSDGYRATLIELALSAFVAHADGKVTESERDLLRDRVAEAKDLTENERKRLKANLDWFLAVPADMAMLRSRLKDVDKGQQIALRTAMIAVAHADGIIQTEEVAGIEKIYRILGLDPSTVYSDLHAGGVADVPVRVKLAEAGRPGEAIPEEVLAKKSVLDSSRIAAIRSDTERVSSVLGQIFQSDQDIEQEQPKSASLISGLDAKYAALVREVIAKDHWSTESFEELASKHGLMAAGAIEAINEWSFTTYGEALLDEYNGYDVSDEITQTLKTQLEKEVA